MTWLGALRESRASIEDPSVPLTSSTLVDMLVGPKSDAGVNVTAKTAFGMPAVYRAIALLSGTVGSLPLHAYRDDNEGQRAKITAPWLVRAPHPDLTPFEWMELSLVHQLSWGNTYYRKLSDGSGALRELWPIEPSRVKVGRAKDGSKVYSIDAGDLSGGATASGASIEDRQHFTDEEILHVPGMGYDGIVGLSPIACARQGIGLAMAAEKFGAKLFGSGNLMTGILSTEQRLTPDEADFAKARWKQQHSGLDAAHDVGVLGQGMKFQSISVPPEDAQFIESRRFQISEIARIFGVPPHMLMDTEKSTSWGTGIEQQGIGFVVYTLRPWLVRFEQRLSRLLPQPQYVKFSVEALLRGDTKSRYASYAVARQWGWLNVDEIRELEDRKPLPDGAGQTYLEPMNMAVAGTQDDDDTEPANPLTEEEPADA